MYTQVLGKNEQFNTFAMPNLKERCPLVKKELLTNVSGLGITVGFNVKYYLLKYIKEIISIWVHIEM